MSQGDNLLNGYLSGDNLDLELILVISIGSFIYDNKVCSLTASRLYYLIDTH